MKLDIFESQPKQSTLAPFLFSEPPAPRPTSNPTQINEITSALISSWTSEGIQGFETVPEVVALHNKLANTADPMARLHIATELKNRKTCIYAERAGFSSVVSDFQDVCGVVAATSSPRAAKEIHVISSHLIKVGSQIAGLAGYGALAAAGAVTPIGLGCAMVMAVIAISDLCAKQGPTIEEATLSAVYELANQIRELQVEMNRRFDNIEAVLGGIEFEILTQFSLINRKADNIHALLELVHQHIVTNQLSTKHTLNSITQSIAMLNQTITDKTTRDMVDKIAAPINRIIFNANGGYIEPTAFRKIATQLLTAIRETSKRSEVAGAASELNCQTISKWQTSETSAQWADYHINQVRMFATKLLPLGNVTTVDVSNPLLWSYSTLALLLLYRKQYSMSSDRHARHITTTELKNIEQAAIEGELIKELLQQLRSPVIYPTLLEQCEQASLKLFSAYQEALRKFQDLQIQQIETERKIAETKRQEEDVKALKLQQIEPGWKYHAWFNGHTIFEGNGQCNTFSVQNNSGSDVARGYQPKESYVQSMKAQYLKQKEIYLESCPQVIYPDDGNGPVLPITRKLIETISKALPENIQHALELNVFALRFRYFIKNNQFHLITYMDDHLCHQIQVPYTPLFYKGDEAIWLFWVGGECPLDNRTSTLHVGTHHAGGRCYYSYHVYTPIKAQRHGCLESLDLKKCINHVPQTELKLIETAVNRSVTKKYDALRERFNLEIRNSFKSDEDSNLGLAIIGFEAQFKMLKAILALCYHDDFEKEGSVLKRLLVNTEAPTSREKILLYLQAHQTLTGLELFDEINHLLATYKEHLPRLMQELKTSLPYALLDKVIGEIQRFVEDYSPTQVSTNDVVLVAPGREIHEELGDSRTRVNLLEGLLMAVKESVDGLKLTDPATAERLETSIRSGFQSFVQSHPHLATSQAAAAIAASPARMIAQRGDGPVFSLPTLQQHASSTDGTAISRPLK